MTICEECQGVEQGTREVLIDGEEVEVCSSCGSEEVRHIDEDYGRDR